MESDSWRRRIVAQAPTPPRRRVLAEITRAQTRSPRLVRTAPGRYLAADVDRTATGQRIVEAAQRLSPGGAVTGWASLHLHGVGFCEGLDAAGSPIPVPLAIGQKGRIRERAGATPMRGLLREEDLAPPAHGIPLVLPERAALDAARLARAPIEAVVELDKALSAGVVTRESLAAYLRRMRGWKGAPLLRQALARASSRVRSPQETRLRLFLEDEVGLQGLMVNATVTDLRGNVVGEVDLPDPQRGVALEYDGSDHDKDGQRSWDAVKEDKLRALGLETVRVAKGHLGRSRELGLRVERAGERAMARRGSWTWRAEERALEEEQVSDTLDAETRAWLAGADWA